MFLAHGLGRKSSDIDILTCADLIINANLVGVLDETFNPEGSNVTLFNRAVTVSSVYHTGNGV